MNLLLHVLGVIGAAIVLTLVIMWVLIKAFEHDYPYLKKK